jgi:hypothetical protein
VAFTGSARNLPGGNDLEQHLYLRDIRTGRTHLVSVSSGVVPANADSLSPSISGDGRFVVFTSTATNLDDAAAGGGFADVYVHDRCSAARPSCRSRPGCSRRWEQGT